MTQRGGVRLWISLPVLLLFTAAQAYAAEEGGGKPPDHATEIFRWINFAILAGVLIWVFAKALPPVFHRNAERISAAITKATAEKDDADRRVREAESKLAHLEQEVAALRASAEQESAAEGERIRALAQTEAKKVAIAAQAEIEATERAARMELKALAAKLAVDGAESLLTKQLTPAAQDSLMNAFVKSLEGRPN
jgi:F-type H+-transporting ATPase subunit b